MSFYLYKRTALILIQLSENTATFMTNSYVKTRNGTFKVPLALTALEYIGEVQMQTFRFRTLEN